MNIEDLINETVKSGEYAQADTSFNYGQNIVKEIEAEFTGESTVRIERLLEKSALKKEIDDCFAALKRAKNIKTCNSPSRRAALNQKASDERKKLRDKIARAKVRLDEICIETGEPLESEKKEMAINAEKDKAQKEAKEKIGWGSSTPYTYDNDYDF